MNIKYNFMIVCEKSHPHYNCLKKHFKIKSVDEAIASYETYDLVIDLTILRTDKKIFFLKELARTTRADIISDLTCTFQEKVFKTLPQVKASISSFFYSPTNTVEYYISPSAELHTKKNIEETLTQIYDGLNLKLTESKILEITFIAPRIVSQIINEAYFALEENLATECDIDKSMLYGVNYPLGPIEWGKKSGLNHILNLMEELYSITHDFRYRPSLKLKKECL